MSSQRDFDLTEYLSGAVEKIVADSLRATFDNPLEVAFLMQFSLAAKKAAVTRQKHADEGERIPPFLIASITRECNLHCAGCYAHANNPCAGQANEAESKGCASDSEVLTGTRDMQPKKPMSAADWDKVFEEAEKLGISFIFLVGGEPMMQRDVIECAGHHKSILFPIITNGLFIDGSYLKLLHRCRNLLPVISLEGGERSTDLRRGEGIYKILQRNMQKLRDSGIPFGVSITATTGNMEEITSEEFLEELSNRGCKMVLYVEYVATAEDDRNLEPDEETRTRMEERLLQAREKFDRMLFLSFPGDEKAYGGCLAAGRGFFHISAEGDAEPCPFAPFSDCNVRDTSVRDALKSRLFSKLEERDMLQEDHSGGCALAGKGSEIEELL